MTRFFSILLWTGVFLLLLTGIDQLLVRVPASSPVPLAAATFYRDLRSRMVDLARGVRELPAVVPAQPAPARDKIPPASIEALIEQRQSRQQEAPPALRPLTTAGASKAPAQKPANRYVYADDKGEIRFAETLTEIPEQYRDKARPLGN